MSRIEFTPARQQANGRPAGRALRLAGILAAWLAALCLTQGAAAQSTNRSPSYWQFAASGRLDSVVLSDVDADGIDEIIALDENGRLTLLTADGQQRWTFQSPDSVAAVGAMAVDAGLPQRSIAVAAGQQLTLLDVDGQQRWQLPLDTPTAPVAVTAYDFETDGDEDILVTLGSGHLLVYARRQRQMCIRDRSMTARASCCGSLPGKRTRRPTSTRK